MNFEHLEKQEAEQAKAAAESATGARSEVTKYVKKLLSVLTPGLAEAGLAELEGQLKQMENAAFKAGYDAGYTAADEEHWVKGR